MLETLTVLALAIAVWTWSRPDEATRRLRRTQRSSPDSSPEHSPLREVRRHLEKSKTAHKIKALYGRAAEARLWRNTVIELCQSISAELTAGRTPTDAVVHAASATAPPVSAAFAPVIASARDGGDVAAALLSIASHPGAEGLRRLAACWQASRSTGAAPAPLVDRVASSVRDSTRHHEELTAHLAGPRATAKLLAALPLLGILMAVALGMNPLAFLFGGPIGLACLVLGVLLNLLGLWWIHRMVVLAQQT
ncbi:type II secretion system F family protein [Sinosporangium siamense]|uniref:Type II secretion system protein GspF domain-containing protein n=1 Tax=Sinosporangium siamense TaxID=1367973 RepID=A0A919RGX0_9ACTN|nr:type II secretion system F family protein [Sinosporangium siamense]GII93670.1 hypothetical protein Ssi02_39010 [Sinosporangium siamense]